MRLRNSSALRISFTQLRDIIAFRPSPLLASHCFFHSLTVYFVALRHTTPYRTSLLNVSYRILFIIFSCFTHSSHRLLKKGLTSPRFILHFAGSSHCKRITALLTATKSSPGDRGRVVNITSVMHHFQDLNFNMFKDGPARKKMGSFRLYYQSKFVCHMIIAIVGLNFVVALLTSFEGQCRVRYGDCAALQQSRNCIDICAPRYELISVSSKFKFTHQTQVQ